MATIYDSTDMTTLVYQNNIYKRPQNASNKANEKMIEWLNEVTKDVNNVTFESYYDKYNYMDIWELTKYLFDNEFKYNKFNVIYFGNRKDSAQLKHVIYDKYMNNNNVIFYKCNNQEIMDRYSVNILPTILFLKNYDLQSMLTGSDCTYENIDENIKKYLFGIL